MFLDVCFFHLYTFSIVASLTWARRELSIIACISGNIFYDPHTDVVAHPFRRGHACYRLTFAWFFMTSRAVHRPHTHRLTRTPPIEKELVSGRSDIPSSTGKHSTRHPPLSTHPLTFRNTMHPATPTVMFPLIFSPHLFSAQQEALLTVIVQATDLSRPGTSQPAALPPKASLLMSAHAVRQLHRHRINAIHQHLPVRASQARASAPSTAYPSQNIRARTFHLP